MLVANVNRVVGSSLESKERERCRQWLGRQAMSTTTIVGPNAFLFPVNQKHFTIDTHYIQTSEIGEGFC
jgi:hypothetical protein